VPSGYKRSIAFQKPPSLSVGIAALLSATLVAGLLFHATLLVLQPQLENPPLIVPTKPAVHSSDVVDAASQVLSGGRKMRKILHALWSNQQGQDIAEYAVMLAVILVIVVGTIRLVGSNANKVFSSVASSVQ
jgi:Flp pilus assembly pilin Flp